MAATPVAAPAKARRRFRFGFRSKGDAPPAARRHIRERFNYTAALRAASPGAPRTKPRREVESAWTLLWESISNGGEISPADEAAIVACERWRRKIRGERNGLWTRMASSFRHSHDDWHRLTTAIRRGVPPSLRGPVWYACGGATVKRHGAEVAYAELVRQGAALQNEATAVIEVDLPRTGVGEEQIGQLRNILRAFAVRNPGIGYCQSMNFITKALLLYNEEERAFWLLCGLLEDVLPAGYYSPSMGGLRADLRLLDSLIGQFLPNLKNHLVQHGIDLSPITMNWFLCLFVNTLPAEPSHRVIDCLLHEGPKVLFRAALGILSLREAELLRTEAVVDAYMVLRAPFGSGQSEEDEGSPDAAASAAPSRREDLLCSMYGLWLTGLSTDLLLNLREEHLKAVAAEDAVNAAKKEAYRKEVEAAKEARAAQAALDESASRLAAEAEAAALPPRATLALPSTAMDVRPAAAHGEGAADDDPVARRQHSFALFDQLPVETSRLGFAERPADRPAAAVSWLAHVTGDDVQEAPDKVNSFNASHGFFQEECIEEGFRRGKPDDATKGADSGGDQEDAWLADSPPRFSSWLCCRLGDDAPPAASRPAGVFPRTS